MKYILRNITIPVTDITQENEYQLLVHKASGAMHISPESINQLRIVKESIDSRRKSAIQIVYTLSASVEKKAVESKDVIPFVREEVLPAFNETPIANPVIIGAGPCGLFSAWELCERGFSPIIVERGEEVEKRTASVEKFWKSGVLNTESNVQFGEGGAGTFSDGKLTTRINDPRSGKVLDVLTRFGAPKEILYKGKAHVGTDVLRDVVRSLREYLRSKGCTFLFNTRMTELQIQNQKVVGVRLSDGTSIETEAVILAIGHSARDTFETLLHQGVDIIQKAFSVGVRIEHLQETINTAQYGEIRHFKLGPADYQLFEHLKDRTAYTFCMCPGGVVVASASEAETVVTNGMSYHARDGVNANAAYVVSVGPPDFAGNHPLAGVAYQRELERACYRLSKSYAAPIQKLSDFLDGRPSQKAGRIKPGYTGEVVFTDLNRILPLYVAESIKASVSTFNRKLKGFMDPDALLTAVETRTSSPVRIIRGENLQSVSVKGLFPAGEGAGYAGGIISSAVDGIRVAERVSVDFSR